MSSQEFAHWVAFYIMEDREMRRAMANANGKGGVTIDCTNPEQAARQLTQIYQRGRGKGEG